MDRTVGVSSRARKGSRAPSQELPRGATGSFPIEGTADVPPVVVATMTPARRVATVPTLARLVDAAYRGEVPPHVLWSSVVAMVGGEHTAADLCALLVRAIPVDVANQALGWSRSSPPVEGAFSSIIATTKATSTGPTSATRSKASKASAKRSKATPRGRTSTKPTPKRGGR